MGHFSPFQVGRIIIPTRLLLRQQAKTTILRRHKSTSADRDASDVPKVTDKQKCPTSATQTPHTISPLPLWRRLGPLSTAFAAYDRAQRQRSYLTVFCSAVVIYFCGDLAAQNIGGEEYEPSRTGRNITIGAICSIPSYKWFLYLGTCFNYHSKIFSLVTKVVVNQFVFTPLFNSYYFGMQSLLSGDGVPEIWERVKRTVPVSFVNSWKLWPAVTAFSFTYIDPQYRALFAGVIAIGWQCYLSWLNKHAADEQARKTQELLV